jgi:hypothetical protein
MMSFTTQQLQGGVKYSTGVKLGNWDEDIARLEIASRDFESRRAKGELLHLRKAREAAFLSQSAPHSTSRDGLIRFGDALQLETRGDCARVLSNHVFSYVAPGHARVTAGQNRAPMARNVWKVRAVRGTAGGGSGWARAPGVPDDDVLRFGDRIRLEADDALVADASSGALGGIARVDTRPPSPPPS